MTKKSEVIYFVPREIEGYEDPHVSELKKDLEIIGCKYVLYEQGGGGLSGEMIEAVRQTVAYFDLKSVASDLLVFSILELLKLAYRWVKRNKKDNNKLSPEVLVFIKIENNAYNISFPLDKEPTEGSVDKIISDEISK